MATVAPRHFAFIEVNDLGKPKATDRKLIRSQCMRGKNKHRRIGVRSVSPLPSLAKHGEHEPSPMSASASTSSDEPPERVSKKIAPGVRNKVDASKPAEPRSVVPAPPPSDLALLRFPCEVDDHSQELIFHFMNEAGPTMYPLELCVDFDHSRSEWFQWLFQDACYLQAVLFGVSATQDLLLHRPTTLSTYSYFRRTIMSLNENLSSSGTNIQDSTVAVIIQLTILAFMTNDHVSAKTHISGLKRIVRLRGGLETFRHNPKLYMKIDRLDLAYSFTSGDDLTLAPSLISWNPLYYNIGPFFTLGGCNPAIYGIQDPRVSTIFLDFQHYTFLINGATENSQRREVAEFQRVICSVQSRLMRLQGTIDDIFTDCIRLGMLALVTTTFQHPFRRMPYPLLAERFRDCCRAVEMNTPERQDLMLWLLVVGAISVFKIDDEPWMSERWRIDVPDIVWPEARRRLKDIMWIHAIHDKLGQKAFAALSGKPEVFFT